MPIGQVRATPNAKGKKKNVRSRSRRYNAAHGQRRIRLPLLRKLLHLELQIDVGDVAYLDDKEVGRRKDLQRIHFAHDVAWRLSGRRSQNDGEWIVGLRVDRGAGGDSVTGRGSLISKDERKRRARERAKCSWRNLRKP